MESSEHTSTQQGEAYEQMLERLHGALRTDGDFPARAKVVQKLRTLARDPNTSIQKLAEVILYEPSLGMRVLHVVNSSYYMRPEPITTITQAITQMGMQTLTDLCGGLILLQKFVPAARRGGLFAESLKKSIMTSLLASLLQKKHDDPTAAELAYLAGSFHSLGHLLLAYYFPQLHEAAQKRAQLRHCGLTQSITEMIGLSECELNMSILRTLEIPNYYQVLIEQSYHEAENSSDSTVQSLSAAAKLAEHIVSSDSDIIFFQAVSELAQVYRYNEHELLETLCALPEMFHQHCQMVDLEFLSLPEFIENIREHIQGDPREAPSHGHTAKHNQRLREAVLRHEPFTSIIGVGLETLIFDYHFDSAMLLVADKTGQTLAGKMSLGKPFPVDIRKLLRSSLENTPDAYAYQNSTSVASGRTMFRAIFVETARFIAIPVGLGSRKLGVLYAEAHSGNHEALHPKLFALEEFAFLLNQSLT